MQQNAQVKPLETADNGDVPTQRTLGRFFSVIVLADI